MASQQVVHVAGCKGGLDYEQLKTAVEGMSIVFPERLRLHTSEFESAEEFATFAATKCEELGVSHSESPLVWVGDDRYVGGFDEALEFLRSAFASRRTPPTVGHGDVAVDLVKAAEEKQAATAGFGIDFGGGGGGGAGGAGSDKAADGSGYDYDLVVIGGGSGGLACSKEAADMGARVAVLDFVKPSPAGSTWGLGGTCVNVGCIPKKLMHTAALVGETLRADAEAYGWSVPEEPAHDWEELVGNVQDHIRSLNFGYRVQLRDRKVTYLNALGSLAEGGDGHTVRCVDAHGEETSITAARIVLAVGGRPTPLPCDGAELAISSDDLFSLSEAPGKTLVVGASYVALECAGFLRGLGYDTTVMVRSILLRGFDQQMADLVGQHMADSGVRFLRGNVPHSLQRDAASGRIRVRWAASSDPSAVVGEELFDTVVAAIGRRADTAALNLESAGVSLARNGKVVTDAADASSTRHVFAIGDVADGRLELTPVAIDAGRRLARRLFGGSSEGMDYELVPTTVFTPLEYGACGLSEEDAIARFGEADVDAYHAEFTPLEWTVSEERGAATGCYAKVVVRKSDSERVVGMHIAGPHAGEVVQGFATAMRLGMTHADLTQTVGIHPTVAEELTGLTISKSSGESAAKTGC